MRPADCRCFIAVAVVLAVGLLGCGDAGGIVFEAGTDVVAGDPGEEDRAESPPREPGRSPTPSPPPPEPEEASTTAAPPSNVVTDRWEHVPSLDGSPPTHESDIERAIDTALADPNFDGWLEWFDRVTVTHIRSRGDGVLVRVELDPQFDPAIPEHHRHGYPTAVCFKGTSTNVIAGVVWLVDPGEGRVLASSPIWADGINCALW